MCALARWFGLVQKASSVSSNFLQCCPHPRSPLPLLVHIPLLPLHSLIFTRLRSPLSLSFFRRFPGERGLLPLLPTRSRLRPHPRILPWPLPFSHPPFNIPSFTLAPPCLFVRPGRVPFCRLSVTSQTHLGLSQVSYSNHRRRQDVLDLSVAF